MEKTPEEEVKDEVPSENNVHNTEVESTEPSSKRPRPQLSPASVLFGLSENIKILRQRIEMKRRRVEEKALDRLIEVDQFVLSKFQEWAEAILKMGDEQHALTAPLCSKTIPRSELKHSAVSLAKQANGVMVSFQYTSSTGCVNNPDSHACITVRLS